MFLCWLRILLKIFWKELIQLFSPMDRLGQERHIQLWEIILQIKVNKIYLIFFQVSKEVYFHVLWKWLWILLLNNLIADFLSHFTRSTMKKYVTSTILPILDLISENLRMGRYPSLILLLLRSLKCKKLFSFLWLAWKIELLVVLRLIHKVQDHIQSSKLLWKGKKETALSILL